MKLRYFLRGLGSGVVVTALVLSIANTGKNESLSDQEIIKRAEKLGMVQQEKDSGLEASNSPTVTEMAEPTVTGKADKNFADEILVMATEAVKPNKESEITKELELTKEAEPTKVTEPTKETEPTKATEPTKETEPTKATEPTKEAEPTKAVKPTQKVEAPTATVTPKPTPKASDGIDTGEKKVLTIVSGMWSDQVARELQAMGVVESATDFDAFLVKNGYANRIVVGTFEIPENASYEQIANIITNR